MLGRNERYWWLAGANAPSRRLRAGAHGHDPQRLRINSLLASLVVCLFAAALFAGEMTPSARHRPAAVAAVTPQRRASAARRVVPAAHGATARPVALRTCDLRITAYCPQCAVCDTGDTTATGTDAWTPGAAVAADPDERAVPLGTRIFVEPFGWLRVDDTGGRVGPHQIDVRLRSHAAAQRWGSRVLPVGLKRRFAVRRVRAAESPSPEHDG